MSPQQKDISNIATVLAEHKLKHVKYNHVYIVYFPVYIVYP